MHEDQGFAGLHQLYAQVAVNEFQAFFVVTWGGGILLAGHTRFSWANPTAGGRRLCLTRYTPNTRGGPALGPKTAEESNPYTPLVCYS
jgi:hypothetical protein